MPKPKKTDVRTKTKAKVKAKVKTIPITLNLIVERQGSPVFSQQAIAIENGVLTIRMIIDVHGGSDPSLFSEPTKARSALADRKISHEFAAKVALTNEKFAITDSKIDIHGGMEIFSFPNGKKNAGTVSIGCTDNQNGNGSPSLLTAAHVVGAVEGEPVFTLNENKNQIQIGEVTRTGLTQSNSKVLKGCDAAVVKVNNNAIVSDMVIIGGKSIPISIFESRANKGDLVIHGGMMTGKIPSPGAKLLSTGKVDMTSVFMTIQNTLSNRPYTPSLPLFTIIPHSGNFAIPGDSGGPVLRMNADGTNDLVGILVAVDSDGVGYAHHMESKSATFQDGIAGNLEIVSA